MNVSSSRRCMCGGAPCPAGVISSDIEYAPPVISLGTLIVIVSAKTLHFFPSPDDKTSSLSCNQDEPRSLIRYLIVKSWVGADSSLDKTTAPTEAVIVGYS